MSHPPQEPLTPDPLTERELDVLRLVAQGKSNKEIAEQLVIAEMTVRTHVSNILGKLHLASRTQAALYALREGLASLDDSPINEQPTNKPPNPIPVLPVWPGQVCRWTCPNLPVHNSHSARLPALGA